MSAQEQQTADQSACADGDHDWEYIADWEGDPGVVNGTRSFYYKRCRICDEHGEWDGYPGDEFDDNYI